ncbi:MAG: aspartate carbamoyltransferase [Deltaproteobacteria bacterium RIFCSPLOWO2_12_FULL_40_28]|nr:MAG: aspartate carbamoyltransferase [Deltaproteobacteria bacterium RIFCSPHIGHO2_02_FULL_40_28]OGQ20282.1 MAG: aspartate carbamoyltransferase [Deltaproteobacteria bacterium RIFCSPHIGHO2_12_FULL_40_32]OGQ40393.1 MAG: aspartate carbamoyltransferase [Deltaproteobacteria bacterium RIFCSPLOWO2_02_FULL_40_36]OGQ54862.1 MAG: aspartate carbamoyltransferase [Deltaproteobacteria bacterium RIFCSPLOWO2_12_FULL_40_28]
MQLKNKDLLGIEQLSIDEILSIIETARSFQEVATRTVKKVPTLRGKTVINLFFESSTRTRTSFEIAGKRLSADVINISQSGSAVEKGESLLDTAKNLEAMGPDIIVCRHKASGAPHILAKHLKSSVINAGDGAHEHPTQALLDMMTILDYKKKIEGLKVAIVGDIAHSRVARSNIIALKKIGAKVTVVGPCSMIPKEVEKLGVKVSHDLCSGIENTDVIMMLRIQKERLGLTPFPTLREYARLYGLNLAKLKSAKKDVTIMHPGPVNRGVEIDPEVADGPYSVILDQVANGVAIRMAVLYLLSGENPGRGVL